MFGIVFWKKKFINRIWNKIYLRVSCVCCVCVCARLLHNFKLVRSVMRIMYIAFFSHAMRAGQSAYSSLSLLIARAKNRLYKKKRMFCFFCIVISVVKKTFWLKLKLQPISSPSENHKIWNWKWKLKNWILIFVD